MKRKADNAYSKNTDALPVKTGAQKGVTALARQHTKEAVERAVELMRQDKFPAVSMRAIEWLIDRGWGKAVQPIADGTDHPALELDLTGVGVEELTKYERTLTKLLGRAISVQDAEFEEISPSQAPISVTPDPFEQSVIETYKAKKEELN